MSWKLKFDVPQKGTKIEVTDASDIPSDWSLYNGQKLTITRVDKDNFYFAENRYLFKKEFKVI